MIIYIFKTLTLNSGGMKNEILLTITILLLVLSCSNIEEHQQKTKFEVKENDKILENEGVIVESTSQNVDYLIINTSNLLVDELYNQKGRVERGSKMTYLLPEFSGGIKAKYTPKLNFFFKENAMFIDKDSVVTVELPEKMENSIPATLRTRGSKFGRITKKTDLGIVTITLSGTSCDDTDYNTFLLESEGKVIIEGLLNIELFTTDSDKDGIDEIYIFSYGCCINSIKVIRIKKTIYKSNKIPSPNPFLNKILLIIG